jgi:hypothetical protein
VELLFQSFDVAGTPPAMYELVARLQAQLGERRTVWGVKWDGERLWWEFYVYNFRDDGEPVAIQDVARALGNTATAIPGLDRRPPDSMFSFDATTELAEGGPLDTVRVYVPGLDALSGLSYRLDPQGLSLENFYAFFPVQTAFGPLKDKLKLSAFVDWDRVRLHELLLPELVACKTICAANKRHCDAVYFGGIRYGQFIHFLKHYGYPEALVARAEAGRDGLDYLELDVGFDFRMGRSGLAIVKSGYYGTF